MNRLLLVEDDLPIQNLIRALMKRIGFEIVCASDGAEGLRELRRGEFDVVLLDLLLPGTSGFEILREVKSFQPELLPRVIVMTASACTPTLRDREELRMVRRVMQKPLDIEELLAEVVGVSATRKPLQPSLSRRQLRKTG